MCLCLVVLCFKWLCIWVGDSSNLLWLFKPLSPIAYGNKVVVSRCANLRTPCTKMFCCLPLRTFNVKSKCNCKSGNSIIAALRYEKTLSIMSPYVLDSWCFVSFKIIFCLGCSFVVSSSPNPHWRLLCLGIAPPYTTPCEVPISLTIEPPPMFGRSILKNFMTCLQIMACASRG